MRLWVVELCFLPTPKSSGFSVTKIKIDVTLSSVVTKPINKMILTTEHNHTWINTFTKTKDDFQPVDPYQRLVRLCERLINEIKLQYRFTFATSNENRSCKGKSVL